MGIKKDTVLKIDNGIDDDIAFPLTHLGQIQVSIDDTTKLQTYLENTFIRFSDVTDSAEFLLGCLNIEDMRTYLNVYSKEEADALFSNPTQIEMSAVLGLETALGGKVNSNQVLTNVPLNALFTDTIYTLTKEAVEEVLTGEILSHTHPSDNTWRGIVNDLTTGGIAVSLSAEQGKVLKGLIDNINTLLGTDDITLDSMQEIINFIEQNKEILDTLTISNIAGLQAALDNKVNINQVLTNVPAGAVFTDTVYVHPASHPISFITGLQQELDNKVDNSRVLTPVPLGALFTDTDTIYTHPDFHPISMITGLQAALDSKALASHVLTPVPLNAIFTDTVYTHPSTHPISMIEGLQDALNNKAPLTHTHDYLSTGGGDLTRGTSGDILRLIASPTELDIALYIGIADGSNSFRLKYWGTGQGNTNAITLQSSTATLFHSYQDGIVNFPNGLKLQGVTVVKTDDPRLTDARAPLAHDQAISTIVGLQNALDGKVNNSRVLTDVPAGAVFTDTWRPIIDSLTSISTTSSLSANQGRILKGLIDNINTLLLSDTATLDTLQEIVDFIETNKATLDTLGISNIAGLQNALDGKVDDSQVLTNVPENAIFTDTIYTHPSSHPISMITGLQDALDAKMDIHTHPYLPLAGGIITGELDMSDRTKFFTTFLMSFKNADGGSTTYPYTGFYQWGSKWQVNARNASNVFQHNLLQIDNITKVAEFYATPLVNSVALVLTNDARLSDARTPLAHTHPYLPLTGGTLSGDTTLNDGTNTSPELKFQNTTFIVGIDLFNDTRRLRFIDRTNAVSRLEIDMADGSIYAGTIVQATNFYISNANTKLSEGTSDSIRLSTPSGYIDIGPMNSAWAHIQTDRPNFYFNKGMSVDGNITVYSNQTTVIENSTGYIKELGQRVYSPNNKPKPVDVDYMGAVTNFDLNYKQGQYYVAGEFTGAPTTGVLYGKLIVEVNDHTEYNGSTNWVWQTFQDTSGRIWKRHKINASAWTTWRLWYYEGLIYERGTRVYSPNNKPSMSDLGGRTASEITTEIATALSDLIAAAPGTMDTLNELAAALGDDPNFATTMTNALALKAPLANPTFTGIVTTDGDLRMGPTGTIYFNPTAGTLSKIVGAGNGIDFYSDDPINFYESDSTVLAIAISTNNKTLDAKGGLLENGVMLSAKYLGINAKAADSNLLDGIDSTGFWQAMGSWKPGSLSAMTRVIGITAESGASNFGLATLSGKMYAYVDGKFYQDEGAYEVIDTNSGDARYLGKTAKAADSELLDGLNSDVFGRVTPEGTWHSFTDPLTDTSGFIDASWTNKFEFFSTGYVLQETSSDGINFTTTTEYTDAQLKDLLGGDGSANIAIPNLGTIGTAWKRFTFTCYSYVSLSLLYLYNTRVSGSFEVKVEKRQVDTWTTVKDYTNIGGWPAHNTLRHGSIWFNPSTTSTGHHWQVRITIKGTTTNASYINHSLNKLQWWGGYPSSKRNLWYTDKDKNVAFPMTISSDNGNFRVKDTADLGFTNASQDAWFRPEDQYGNVHIRAVATKGFYVDGTVHYFRNQAGNTTYMHIDGNGNVGIGTTSPGAKLDVNGGLDVRGNIRLTGDVTTTNQGRIIDFTGFDKEGTTDFSDRAYIQHTINTAGHTGSVLVISSQNDAADGIGFLTHADSQIKHNSHIMYDAGNLLVGTQAEIEAGTETAQRTWAPDVLKAAIQALSDLDSDTNTYLSSLAFNTSDGVLTATLNDATTVTVDLDGRYAYVSHDHTILKEAGTIAYGTAGLQWRDVSGNGGTGANGTDPQNPYDDWFHHLIMNHANAGGYYTDIITAFHQDRIFFKKVANGTQGTIREIWHDGNFTPSSYLPLSGGDITGSIIIDQNGNNGNIAYKVSGGCYIPRPLGGHHVTTTSDFTGSIAIKLPTASWNKSDMISFWIDIYDYNGDTQGESISIYIYGYQYSTGSWINAGAVILSDRTDKNYTVRFGHDGTRHIVYIAETNTTWNYLQINIRDFQAGYSADYANYDDAFAIAIETTHQNITKISTDNYPVAKDHTHAYLPLAGGTMTGDIQLRNAAGNKGIYSGTYDYVAPYSHSGHTWLRNTEGFWSFASHDDGDDWTKTFQLRLNGDPNGAGANSLWAEIGQQKSNSTNGIYKGVRIVKFVDSTIVDGDLQVGNVLITGNLTISGTTTYVNTTQLNVGDNIIMLNADVTGAPTENAGIEIERGTSDNVYFLWDETGDFFTIGDKPFLSGSITSMGTVKANTLLLENNAGNTSAHRIAVYDSGNTSYGMMLWNTNGTSGEYSTMIYGPNQANRRISFGKITGASFATHADVTEIAYFDLDNYSFNLTGQLISSVATGTAPLTVASTTVVTNLNADMIDGYHSSSIVLKSGLQQFSVAAELGSYVGQVNTLQIFQATASKDAFITFHIANDYALHFGLDYATNDLFVGGWSMGAVKNKIWHAGNFTDNHSNWDTAYNWGDHASANYMPKSGGDFTGAVGFNSTVDITGVLYVNGNISSDGGSIAFTSVDSVGFGGAALVNVGDIYASYIEVNGNIVWNEGNFDATAAIPSQLVSKTSSYTFVLSDKNKFFYMNSSSSYTFTIPLNSAVAFPIGTEIHMARYGTGEVTVGYTTGVTILSEGSKKRINAQYQVVTAKKISTDIWLLFGALKT